MKPRIIRTLADLEVLDPDTILDDSAGPYAAGATLDAIYAGEEEGYRAYFPAVVIATGDTVRAARQALEEA